MSSSPGETHAPELQSWVESANDPQTDFPVQNLPLGIFSDATGEPRGGVAIGDQIFDVRGAVAVGLFSGDAKRAGEAASGSDLNAFLALGTAPRRAFRSRVADLLVLGSPEQAKLEPLLHPAQECTLHKPARVGDYTDFYAGIHHATNVGKQLRPDNPLLPNYKYVPIGYHGRASSVRASGEPVIRPNGQRKAPEAEAPEYGPSRRLDYELELGIWIGAGNELGQPIPIGEAADHIIAGAGFKAPHLAGIGFHNRLADRHLPVPANDDAAALADRDDGCAVPEVRGGRLHGTVM